MLKRAYNKYLILESKKKKKCNLITRTQVQILRIPMMNKCRHKNNFSIQIVSLAVQDRIH